MKPVIVKLMIFTVLFLGVFVQGIADTVSMNPAVQRIDSILSQSDSIEKMGGGGAFILFDKEQVYLSKAYGDFSLDKVVSIASATKWISAGVIVKLHEDGYFDIHDIVRKYYPEYQDGKGDMTIAQLFSHTGGLYDKPNIQRMYRLPSIDIAVHLI